MMRSLFGNKTEQETAPQAAPQQPPAATNIRPPLRPPLTPRPATSALNQDEAASPAQERSNSRSSAADRYATAPAPAEMEDVESIFDLPFTDIVTELHHRYGPLMAGAGAQRDAFSQEL